MKVLGLERSNFLLMAERAWGFVRCHFNAINEALGGRAAVVDPNTMKEVGKKGKRISIIIHHPYPTKAKDRVTNLSYHGVACALAIIGVLFGLKLMDGVAFFGEIDYAGNLLNTCTAEECFKSIPEVWQQMLLKTFILPQEDSKTVKDQKPEPPKKTPDMDVVGCSDMFEVVKKAFVLE